MGLRVFDSNLWEGVFDVGIAVFYLYAMYVTYGPAVCGLCDSYGFVGLRCQIYGSLLL